MHISAVYSRKTKYTRKKKKMCLAIRKCIHLWFSVSKFKKKKKNVSRQDANNRDAVYDVNTSVIRDGNGERKSVRYFKHQLLKYVWDESENAFRVLQGLDNGTTTLSNLLEKCHGLTHEEYASQYVSAPTLFYNNCTRSLISGIMRRKSRIQFLAFL